MDDISTQKQNNAIFSKLVDNYKVSYLRTDEEYLIKKYFNGKIPVLGCGAGRTLRPLKNKGFEVVGIDLNQEMVKEAKTRYPDLQIYQMDATDLKFNDGTFDTAFFPFHGIDYVYPDIYKAVAEARRVLRLDGVFIMSSQNRFFIKRLHKFFNGNYSDNHGLMEYRTTQLDWLRLKKYFKKVKVIQRISISVSWKNSNWKDKIYKLFPFFNKSTYFICIGKK